VEFRDAREEDLPAILETLTDAFSEDPFLTWFVRGGARARDGLRDFFAFMVAGEPRQAQWFEVSQNCQAVALWVRWAHVDPLKPVYSDSEKLARAVNFAGFLRLNNASTADKIVRSAKSDVMMRTGTKDVAYLRFLACRRKFQGKGFGTGVLAQGLARCRELGLPAYLETATARNEQMYRRREFEVEKRYRFGQGEHIRVMVYRP
jgi:N-acetylglutamate synthase-like GNAT family acetyltransferase